jgi:uncharacterized protein
MIIHQALIDGIRRFYRLDWFGTHGIAHFRRVRENGLRLAEETKAKKAVVELFAFFHDARRFNEYEDDLHGRRAAKMVRYFQGVFFDLPPDDLELLIFACEFHTNGRTHDDITVLTCWDADRLDIGRVGWKPIARKLCTEAAKNPEMIEWAYKRSLAGLKS